VISRYSLKIKDWKGNRFPGAMIYE